MLLTYFSNYVKLDSFFILSLGFESDKNVYEYLILCGCVPG